MSLYIKAQACFILLAGSCLARYRERTVAAVVTGMSHTRRCMYIAYQLGQVMSTHRHKHLGLPVV